MKRMMDILVALALLMILFPLFIVTGVAIFMNMGRPVFFKQVRPGIHGKPFIIYKFRTMRDERDREGNLLEDHERLTKLGYFLRRYSIDEIPQLLNVLKGDMSLVGPRPLLMEYLPLYSDKHRRRHEVKPGITGLAQVMGRNGLSWEEKFELDVWYVDHQSIWLDLKILLMTIGKVVKKEGIYQNNQERLTVEKFRGYPRL